MTKGKEVFDKIRGKLLAISQIKDDAMLAIAFRQEIDGIFADFLLLDSNVQSIEKDVIVEKLLNLAEDVSIIAQLLSMSEEETFFAEQPLRLEDDSVKTPPDTSMEK
jgi:hypothetical protein